MLVKKELNLFKIIIVFSLQLVGIIVWSSAVWLMYSDLQIKEIIIPFNIITILGSALGILLAFRNGSAYARWWEARQIWGGLINVSRSFASIILTQTSSTVKNEIVKRHIAYVNTLRFALREEDKYNELGEFLSSQELAEMSNWKNKPTFLIHKQNLYINSMLSNHETSEFIHSKLIDFTSEITSCQGKCERIKKTPLPRPYSFFTKVFMWIFLILLPFGLVETQDYFTIFYTFLIAFTFFIIDNVGTVMEDPFENKTNDIPLTAMCRTIEIDLRQMMEEKNIPSPIQPINGVLW